MAYPSYTYTLTNGTTADASQVMQDLNDILNGVTDGTKDLSIAALTVAGTATLNGNVAIGNASGDDLTVTASLASNLVPKTTGTYSLGSAAIGFLGLYLAASGDADTARIIAASHTADRDYTIPDLGANGTFAFLEGTQTFSGIKNNTAQPCFRAISNGTIAHKGTDSYVKFSVWTDSGTGAFDQGSNFDTTNDRFTVPTGADGVYHFTAQVCWDGGAGGITIDELGSVLFYKNGVSLTVNTLRVSTTNQDFFVTASVTLSLVATDYIEVYVINNSGDNWTTINNGAYTYFQGFKVC